MHLRRFRRLALVGLGSAVVLAMPLALPGCGGASGNQTELVVPKEPPRVTAKDSMNEFFKNHQHKTKGVKR